MKPKAYLIYKSEGFTIPDCVVIGPENFSTYLNASLDVAYLRWRIVEIWEPTEPKEKVKITNPLVPLSRGKE